MINPSYCNHTVFLLLGRENAKKSISDGKESTEDEESKLQFDDDRTSSPIPEMVVYSSDEEEPDKRKKVKKRKRILAFSGK